MYFVEIVVQCIWPNTAFCRTFRLFYPNWAAHIDRPAQSGKPFTQFTA